MAASIIIANRFEVSEFIAQGGMGAVYRGLDRQTGQTVAIKSVRPELVDAALIARFQQEGETLRTLNHPNIVKLVMTVQDGAQHYLVMEYVSGGSLADLLAKQSSLAADQTVSIALELADALARAHHLKVIHRDLKPANVLLADDGTPRLTDFGVARTAQGNLTGTGVIVGTLSYLAPETLNGEPADARADIWAFGVTLFELLTGRLPFRADSPAALITAILTQPTPDLESLRPELPVALVDLIYRMLDKDPRQRIGSMRQIAAELESIREQGSPNSSTLRIGIIRPKDSPVVNDPTMVMTPPTAPRDNLPVQTTPFVGREAELAELAKMIADPDTRLITILGPGGMGKTRLALEAAAAQLPKFADGVYFVSLAPISDPEAILSATAEAVGFQFYQGDVPPRQQLLNFFREKAMLVVFDNFEHVLAAKTFLADILSTAKNVKLIATSRERLNLQSETLFRIEGMNFPDWETPEDAAEYSAVKLFLQSARRVEPSFELTPGNVKYLARICRLVQGMPLGILLAAAWVDQLSLAEIADEISYSADFLETEQSDVPIRQRSIRAVFDYSWALLNMDEQSVFMKVSVFRGGFTREAVQAITGASLKTLASLVNKSLLRRDPSGRYDVHELLRQYAQSKLNESRDTLAIVLNRHSKYFADLMKIQEPRLKGAELLNAIQLIESEFDNIAIAWNQMVNVTNFAEIAETWRSLWLFTFYRSRWADVQPLVDRAVDTLKIDLSIGANPLLACMLFFQSKVAIKVQGFSSRWYEQCLTAYSLLRQLPAQAESAFVLLFHAANEEPTEDIPYLEESLELFQQLNDIWGMARATLNLATTFGTMERTIDAERYIRQAMVFSKQVGDPLIYAQVIHAFSQISSNHGNYDVALTYLEESCRIFGKIGAEESKIVCLFNIGKLYSDLKDYPKADAYFDDVLVRATRLGYLRIIPAVYMVRGYSLVSQKRFADAKTYFLQELAIRRVRQSKRWIANGLNGLALATIGLQEFEEARTYLFESIIISKSSHLLPYTLESIVLLSDIISKTEKRDRAVDLLVMCIHSPLTFHEVKQNAERYLIELQSAMPVDEFAAAWERGKALDLDTVVAEILAEPPMFSANGPE